MPAPRIRRDASLETIREEIVFPLFACQNDPHAADQAPVLEEVLTKWLSVHTRQLEFWDAQTKASWLITTSDHRLDGHVMDFSKTVHAHAPDREAFYFKQSPTDTRRPVLGAELETAKVWIRALKEESAPELKAFVKIFEADVKAADTAIVAKKDADAANRHFREVGELAKYLDEVEAARDRVFVALDSRRVKKPELGLPRDWASSFFPGRAPSQLTEAERQAKQQALEQARKERADLKQAQRAAKDKVRAAKRELAALKKSR